MKERDRKKIERTERVRERERSVVITERLRDWKKNGQTMALVYASRLKKAQLVYHTQRSKKSVEKYRFKCSRRRGEVPFSPLP